MGAVGIAGFDCHGISGGEQICTRCWDNSGHDLNADVNVPKGESIYWRCCGGETNDWDPYCQKCAAAIEAEIAKEKG
jgi:hypothetical protein